MKKTEKAPGTCLKYRMIVVVLLMFLCTTQLAVTAFASTTEEATNSTIRSAQPTVSGSIAQMNSKIYRLYLLVRNDIAFPLLSLSFASCGFKILGAGFLGSGNGVDRGIQSAKEQLLTSVAALLLILALPYLISYGIQLFKRTAWKPACILHPMFMMGGIL